MGSLETINVKLGTGDRVDDLPTQIVVEIGASPGSSKAKLIAEAFREFNDEQCKDGKQPVKVIEVIQASPNQTPGATNTAPIPDLQEAFIEPSPLRSGIAVHFDNGTPFEQAGAELAQVRDAFHQIFGKPAEQVHAVIGEEG